MPNQLLSCESCGVEFEPKQKTQRYCSRACQIVANNQRQWARLGNSRNETRRQQYAERKGRVDGVCLECGQAFQTLDRRKQFCSRRCKERASAKTTEAKAKRQAYSRENRSRLTESHRQWVAANRKKVRQDGKTRWQGRLQSKAPWFSLLNGAKGRAAKANLPFNLTSEWAAARWTGRCELTDLEFRATPGHGPHFFSATIDRIDAKLGYVMENCRFVIHAINAMKSDGTDADVLLAAIAIVTRLSPNKSTT